MNEILKTIKQNSKRYTKIKSTYNFRPNISLLLNKNLARSKYIIIHKPIKSIIPKFIKNIAAITSLGLLGYFYWDHITKLSNNFQREKINGNIKKLINSLLKSQEIKEGGVELLENIFEHQKAKEATVELLNNLLKDPNVMENTKLYGVGLFNELLKEEEIKTEFKKLLVDLLRMEEIKIEGVNLLQYIIEKEESKDIMAQYFKVIFLRSDIIKSLSSVITDSAIYTMNGATTKKKFAEFVIDVWSDPNLRWNVIKKSLNFWQTASATIKNENGDDKKVREELLSLETIAGNNTDIFKV